jgi:mannose-6-phosphate isomerase-like protein (cupin superfamily)
MGKEPGMASEQLRVLQGTMTFKIGRKTIVAKAGDVVTLPVGKTPKITNGGFTRAQVLIDMPPSERDR